MLTYQNWMNDVPSEITNDTLWRMEVYRIALFMGDIAWTDVSKLAKNRQMRSLSDQLYRSVGSISANIAEGYSKASKKDQARFYEYSLGSARETRDWYYKSRHILGDNVALHRMRLLVSIIRTLLKLVPEYRGRKIAEEFASYEVHSLESLLENTPF